MKLMRRLTITVLTMLCAWSALADPPHDRGHFRNDGRDSRNYEQRDNSRDYERRNYREYDARDNYSRRPIRDVIGEVEHNYRGRVVDVQPPRSDADEDMYRVRVLQEGGRVKTLHVPADRRRER